MFNTNLDKIYKIDFSIKNLFTSTQSSDIGWMVGWLDVRHSEVVTSQCQTCPTNRGRASGRGGGQNEIFFGKRANKNASITVYIKCLLGYIGFTD